MSTARIILVRHAEPQWRTHRGELLMHGWTVVGVTELGRQQAELVAARLQAEAPAAPVYSSDLPRAYLTAEAIAGGRPVRRLRSLREICCGDVEGWSVLDVKRAYPELWRKNLEQADPNFCWPAGESYAYLRRRTVRALNAIARKHSGSEVVVVTHNGVISQIIGLLHGTSPAEWDEFHVEEASVTRIEWRNGTGTVLTFNDCFHLQRLEEAAE